MSVDFIIKKLLSIEPRAGLGVDGGTEDQEERICL